MAAPDPGTAALAAERPCQTRRMLIEAANPALPDYGMFPLDGQYIDTPAGITPKRTSDSGS